MNCLITGSIFWAIPLLMNADKVHTPKTPFNISLICYAPLLPCRETNTLYICRPIQNYRDRNWFIKPPECPTTNCQTAIPAYLRKKYAMNKKQKYEMSHPEC